MQLFDPYYCSSAPDELNSRDVTNYGGDRSAAAESKYSGLSMAPEGLATGRQDSQNADRPTAGHLKAVEPTADASGHPSIVEPAHSQKENHQRGHSQSNRSQGIHIDPSLATDITSLDHGQNEHNSENGHNRQNGHHGENGHRGKNGAGADGESPISTGTVSQLHTTPEPGEVAIAPSPSPSDTDKAAESKPDAPSQETVSVVPDSALPHPVFEDASDLDIGFVPVLKNFNFLALWSGQVFSQLADKIYLVLMIAIISARFQESGQSISGWVSALMIVFTIPAVLFGFAAGVFVDHWPKKSVLVATNLLRGGLVLVLPLLIWMSDGGQSLYGIPFGFFILLGITFLVSTLTQFFAPAEQAAIPLIVPKKHLLSANSLYTTTMMASVIVGFALGEPLLELTDKLVASINPDFSIGKELLVGTSYVLAGLLLLLVRPREKNNRSEHEKPHFWVDMRDGLEYLGAHHKVRAALIQLVILFSVFAALAVLAVRLAELIPTIDSDQFGFLLAAAGVGMAIGATLVGQFGQQFRRSLLSLVGSIGMALCLGLLSLFTQNLWPALICIGLFGGCASLVGIPMQTTIQSETPEAMRGKVFGLQNNAVNIALSLPLALAGIAETLLGIQTVLLGLSAILLFGGLLTWYSSPMRSAQSNSQAH